MSNISTTVNPGSIDVVYGLNEVVSVFVSRYETSLFNKKDKLVEEMTQLKRKMSDLSTYAVNDLEKVEGVLPSIRLTVETVKSTVEWTGYKKSTKGGYIRNYDHRGDVPVVLTELKISIGPNLTDMTVITPVSSAYVIEYNDYKERIRVMNDELMVVHQDIKSVSRKERQIRGHLAEVKLKENGLEDMLTNPEMLQLISVR